MTMITVDLSKLGPVDFDTLQAQVEDAYSAALGRVESAADSLHRANGERGQAKRWGTEWRNRIDETIAQVEADPTRAVRGRIGVTAGDMLKAYRAAVAACDSVAGDLTAMFAEYDSRPWPRYMITQGSDAHIHKDTRCTTCNRGRERTRFGWLIELSGKPIDECIDQFKATMCTVCFPDAPVIKVVDPNVCQGTTVPGTRQVDKSGGRYSTTLRYFGDCSCGAKGIRIKQDGTPAKHKPATPPAAPAPAVEAPAPVKVLAADSAPKRDEVTARVPDAGDAQDEPVVVAPTFGPLDEVEHVDQPGAAWVVERATSAGRLIVRASGALGVTTRVLAVKCRLLQSAADATAGMTRDELVNELVELAAAAASGPATAEGRAALARFRTTVEVRHGFTSKGGGHLFDRSGYSPCQGWGELARMISRDRARAVRIAADTARAVGAVHLRQFVGGVWCGDETPAQATDERRLATCRACESAIALEQLIRKCREDFEAGRPVIDADCEPVDLGTDLVDSPELRLFFLGRVRAGCGHYMAKSERDAGALVCERCPAIPTRDDVDVALAAGPADQGDELDGAVWATIVFNGAPGVGTGLGTAPGAALEIEGDRHPVPDTMPASGETAGPRVAYAIRAAGYEPARGGYLQSLNSDGTRVLVRRLAAEPTDLVGEQVELAAAAADDQVVGVVAGAGAAAGATVPAQRPAATFGEQRAAHEEETGELRTGWSAPWTSGAMTARVIETHREALRQLLRADGFVPGFAPGDSTPRLHHNAGVVVQVDDQGTLITYPDDNIADGEHGEGVGAVRITFGHDYGVIRDVALGLAMVVEAGRVVEPEEQHVTRITGPDSAGHWGYVCEIGKHERTGYDSPDAVIDAATAHGPLAADSPRPVLIDGVPASIPAGQDEPRVDTGDWVGVPVVLLEPLRANVVAFLQERGRAGATWVEVDQAVGLEAVAAKVHVQQVLGDMFEHGLILASRIGQGPGVRYYALGVECDDCEGNGVNCLAHRTYEQRRRHGW